MKIQNIFMEENSFENVICPMSTILLRLQRADKIQTEAWNI